jgi:hypothetical protein
MEELKMSQGGDREDMIGEGTRSKRKGDKQ